jgi:hypothetical protein
VTRPADRLRHSRAQAARHSPGGGAVAAAAVAGLATLALYLRLGGAQPATSAAAAADSAGGVELVSLTPQLGSYFGTAHGVLVVHAAADGALRLEDGDVILAIDGRQPASGAHATRMLSSYRPGAQLVLRIVRRHQTLDLVATLANAQPAPGNAPRQAVVFGRGRA